MAAGLIPADVVAVGIGAFFGALSRYQAGQIAAEWIASNPTKLNKFTGWHTAGINIGGSFLLGGISASPLLPTSPTTSTTTRRVAMKQVVKPPLPTTTPATPRNTALNTKWFSGLSPRTKLMLGVGFCGSYTTFSTYSVDVVTWLSEGKTIKAMKYVAVNNVGGFMAAAAGMILMKKFIG